MSRKNPQNVKSKEEQEQKRKDQKGKYPNGTERTDSNKNFFRNFLRAKRVKCAKSAQTKNKQSNTTKQTTNNKLLNNKRLNKQTTQQTTNNKLLFKNGSTTIFLSNSNINSIFLKFEEMYPSNPNAFISQLRGTKDFH